MATSTEFAAILRDGASRLLRMRSRVAVERRWYKVESRLQLPALLPLIIILTVVAPRIIVLAAVSGRIVKGGTPAARAEEPAVVTAHGANLGRTLAYRQTALWLI